MVLHRRKQPGFTIVELLIVIVVTGILAAITIVAYNGIQQRARNQAKIAAATSIAKALDTYTISKGTQLPGIPFCLPGSKDYNSDGLGDCYIVTNPAAPTYSENVATNAALTSGGITGLGFPQETVTATNGVKYGGVIMSYSNAGDGVGGVLQPYFLYFALEGVDQDCSSGYSVRLTGTSGTLTAITFAKNYAYGSGVTFCAYTTKHVSSL